MGLTVALPDPVALIDPQTGELIDLDDATDLLIAQTLDDVDDLRGRLADYRSALGAEILRRMDARASWTTRAGGFKLSAPSPAPVVSYDGAALWEELGRLAEHGRFGLEALDAAVRQVVTFKPRAAGIKALAKLGPDVAQLIDRHTTYVDPPPRRVRVEPNA